VSFELFELGPRLNANIQALGYREPTPIQTQAIPVAMRGDDILGVAQTGTGKTAAFALPMLQRLRQNPRGRPRALVLAPTRELAQQIHEAFVELGRGTGRRSLPVFGGVNIRAQINELRRGVDIVVACPGRLLDHMRQRTVDLREVDTLVLDEADRMLDMGFLPDIRAVVRQLPSERQTMLFSATMPGDIRRLASEILRSPVTIEVGHSAPVETVSHALYPVDQHLKTKLLLELLQRTDTGSVLVFTRTKHRAKRLGLQLRKAGHDAASLQGNLSQNQRRAAMNGFRNGTHQILVATDIAARGIDVSSVSHVINFDMPDTVDAYTHRIGRTGRAATTGDAFTFATRGDNGTVRSIERVLGVAIERRRLDGFDYSAAAPPDTAGFDRRPRHGAALAPAGAGSRYRGARPGGQGRGTSGGGRGQHRPRHTSPGDGPGPASPPRRDAPAATRHGPAHRPRVAAAPQHRHHGHVRPPSA